MLSVFPIEYSLVNLDSRWKRIALEIVALATIYYPGPLLAKLTDAYSAYHGLIGDLHLNMRMNHDKYGDFCRYGPNKILVNTSRGLNGKIDIYGYGKHIRKSKGYLPILPAPGAWSVHTSIDKEMHGFKRRVISQGLSDDALKAFEPAFLGHCRIFLSQLVTDSDQLTADGWTQPKNMTPICNHYSFDVMGEFGFGKTFQMQNSPENRFIIDAIVASNLRTSIYVQMPWISKLKLEKIFYPKGTEMREKFLQITKELAESRSEKAKDAEADLFSFVADARDPETGKGFSLSELWAETKFLIIAGSDTSSTVLTSTFFYLTRYPDVYKRLADEIRGKFQSIEDITTGPDLSSCVYLRACMDETMRMSPPAGGAMWREVEEGGSIIEKAFFPGGTDVGTSMYSIHHDEKYYPDSYTFKPERWIASETSQEEIDTGRSALNPFSLGPRGCIGKGLALMEIRVTLARTIFAFDFRKPSGELGRVGEGVVGRRDGRHRVNEFQLIDHLTGTKDGPWIEWKKRV